MNCSDTSHIKCKHHIHSFPSKPWDWSGISRNPNIILEFINANPDKP